MIITYRYELTDLGMNHSGVMKIIEDWMKHAADKIPELVGSDYKFVIMMHPEMRHNISKDFNSGISSYALNFVNEPAEIPDADGTFPGAVEAQYTLMYLKIVVTTVLKENELVITSEEFIPLVEGFIKGAAETAYQRGALDAMRMDPRTMMYDENYVFVNLGDEKSVKEFMKKVERKWTK